MPLFNIFSKKNQKKNKEASSNPKILADIHEKDSQIFSNLTELGTDLEIMPLKVGDFQIGNIIIERKTFQDFISSMLSKRLIEQLENMKQYEKQLLIIEGKQPINPKSKIHPNSIKGMILSILNDWRIPIIFSKDENETSDYLFLLSKQNQKKEQGKQNEISLHSRIPKSKKEQKKYILESFEAIGPKTAEKLLKEFKSIKNIFSQNQETLEKIIGKKAEIFKILEEEY